MMIQLAGHGEARPIRDLDTGGSAAREGLVIKKYSGFYYIHDHGGELCECRVRGKIKFEVLSGDRVVFSEVGARRGVIERVLPRLNQLERPRVANVSLALIIMARSEPLPSLMLLDRLLILCQHHHIKPLIILNKSDLATNQVSQAISQHYPAAGFKVIAASAENGQGIEDIRGCIINEIAVLTGPSGAGKSSILNAVLDSPEAATQALSARLRRGKHTTRHVELYPLPKGGWLVDTPGFSMLEMPAIKKNELAAYYPEFSVGTPACRFRNCLHYKEQECGVRQALERGEIFSGRYENYVYILEEIMENERRY